MARQPVVINGVSFKTKKAVLDHVRSNILYQHEDHQYLGAEDLKFMVDLLRHHPWSNQKIGVGVARMWVQKNENYQTRCFWLERHDGTKTDFSFYQCVQPASIERDFKGACRAAVAPTVINFRLDYFRQHAESDLIRCPVTGDLVSIHESHVDHAPPNTFDVIVTEFMTTIAISAEMLTDHTDGVEGNFFADKEIESQWIKFHNERATLRVLSVIANLSIAKSVESAL